MHVVRKSRPWLIIDGKEYSATELNERMDNGLDGKRHIGLTVTFTERDDADGTLMGKVATLLWAAHHMPLTYGIRSVAGDDILPPRTMNMVIVKQSLVDSTHYGVRLEVEWRSVGATSTARPAINPTLSRQAQRFKELD